MKNRFKALTLSEILIAMVIVGVLAKILIPVIMNVLPNKNKALFKKAYYVTEKVVNALLSDETLYPEDVVAPGFAYTTNPVISDGVTYQGTTKFCQTFATKVNLGSDVNCSSVFNFKTNDGVTWALPTGAFVPGIPQVITVDVMGGTTTTNGNSPNCIYNAATCPKPDQFNINVYNDGKLSITGTKEMEYLNDVSAQ